MKFASQRIWDLRLLVLIVDLCGGYTQVGSLAGAAQLLNDTACLKVGSMKTEIAYGAQEETLA